MRLHPVPHRPTQKHLLPPRHRRPQPHRRTLHVLPHHVPQVVHRLATKGRVVRGAVPEFHHLEAFVADAEDEVEGGGGGGHGGGVVVVVVGGGGGGGCGGSSRGVNTNCDGRKVDERVR